MLEKPDIPDERILTGLRAAYGLAPAELTFLPLGADVNTAVYRAASGDGPAYFVKLRRGGFRAITVSLPAFLKAQGITAVIAPLPTLNGRCWAPLGQYRMILYPYIEGKNGYEVELSPRNWQEFGAALRALHAIRLPARLRRAIPCETFSNDYRELVTSLLAQAAQTTFIEPCAAQMAALLRQHQHTIRQLVARAGRLAQELQARPLELVPCHADIHAGNLLIGSDSSLYIVDWDGPRLAPREHDLTLIGGCRLWNDPRQIAWFNQGYACANIDRTALAYYRSERVIMDLAEFGRQLLFSDSGGADREQALVYFAGNFLPGAEIELANQTL